MYMVDYLYEIRWRFTSKSECEMNVLGFPFSLNNLNQVLDIRQLLFIFLKKFASEKSYTPNLLKWKHPSQA